MTYDERGLKFGSVAEQYDAYRPSPPPAAATLMGDLRDKDVLELGAGTGLCTRFLLELGARVSVVEPDDEMRAVLERRSPGIASLAGRAEDLPVPDESFDVVLSSSAWHWFEQPAATMEMARVLRDRGKLFVLWNGFSRDVPWLARLTELRENPGDPGRRPRGWSAGLGDGGLFLDPQDVQVHWTWHRTTEEMLAVFGTYSGSIMKTEAQRRAMNLELRRRIEEVTQTGEVEVPMTLRGTIATRAARLH